MRYQFEPLIYLHRLSAAKDLVRTPIIIELKPPGQDGVKLAPCLQQSAGLTAVEYHGYVFLTLGLKQALAEYGKPDIFNVDQGSLGEEKDKPRNPFYLSK